MILDAIPVQYKNFIVNNILKDPAMKKYLIVNDIDGFLEALERTPSAAFYSLKNVYSFVDLESVVTLSGRTYKTFTKFVRLLPPSSDGREQLVFKLGSGEIKTHKIKECIIAILKIMLKQAGANVKLDPPFE